MSLSYLSYFHYNNIQLSVANDLQRINCMDGCKCNSEINDSPLHKLHFYPFELENFSKRINLPFRIDIDKQ